MLNHKQVTLLALVALTFISTSGATPSHPLRVPRQLLDIENTINEGVKNNVIGVLSHLGTSVQVAGTNVSRAAALVIRGIVREGLNLGGVAAYLPRLIFLDGPNQFIETLRLIRSNQLRVPNDMQSAIDNVITYVGSLSDSGIPQNFAPVVEFFPNIFRGVERFAQEFLYNTFQLVGPIPTREKLDSSLVQQNIRVVSSTLVPI